MNLRIVVKFEIAAEGTEKIDLGSVTVLRLRRAPLSRGEPRCSGRSLVSPAALSSQVAGGERREFPGT